MQPYYSCITAAASLANSNYNNLIVLNTNKVEQTLEFSTISFIYIIFDFFPAHFVNNELILVLVVCNCNLKWEILISQTALAHAKVGHHSCICSIVFLAKYL